MGLVWVWVFVGNGGHDLDALLDRCFSQDMADMVWVTQGLWRSPPRIQFYGYYGGILKGVSHGY